MYCDILTALLRAKRKLATYKWIYLPNEWRETSCSIMAKRAEGLTMEFASVQSLTMTILYSWLVVYEFIPLPEVG